MKELNGFAMGVVATALAAWMYVVVFKHYLYAQGIGAFCVW